MIDLILAVCVLNLVADAVLLWKAFRPVPNNIGGIPGDK